MTRQWRWDGPPTSDEIDPVARLLLAGGVVLLPTDTIYGIHVVATNARAVARVAQIKERVENRPFVALCGTIGQLGELGITLTAQQRNALTSIWPAPLTAIFSIQEPSAASRGAMTQAVRVPGLEWLRELLLRTGPLVSTSANRSGDPPVLVPSALPEDVGNALDGVVDAGVVEGEPSLIIDLSGREPKLIRESNEAFTQKVWKTLRKSL